MSSPAPFNALQSVAKACTRQTLRACRLQPTHRSPFSTSSAALQEADVYRADRPRWQHAPKGMAMPVRTRPAPTQPVFEVNDKPEVLNDAYNRILGKGGDKILPEEIKWLAVTHKSFDHGRRGFNDRLAFLGKRIVDLQCSLALLSASGSAPSAGYATASHPALKGLHNVTASAKQRTLDKQRLAQLAQSYGLGKVIRWKPRKTDRLQSSGEGVVLAHTMYSIVGALALQKGGDFTNNFVQERILSPLGLR